MSNAANDINTYFITINVFFIVAPAPRIDAASGWLMLTVLAPSRCTALLHTAEREPLRSKLIPAAPATWL
jgi:hypothetical protein